jgi:hypothetical protein
VEDLVPTFLPTIAPYAPASLVRAVLDHPDPTPEPISKRFPAAVLFADISGFTSLTEALSSPSTAHDVGQLVVILVKGLTEGWSRTGCRPL